MPIRFSIAEKTSIIDRFLSDKTDEVDDTFCSACLKKINDLDGEIKKIKEPLYNTDEIPLKIVGYNTHKPSTITLSLPSGRFNVTCSIDDFNKFVLPLISRPFDAETLKIYKKCKDERV